MRKAAACFTTTSCVTGSALFQALLTGILAGLLSSLVKSVAQARQKSLMFNTAFGGLWEINLASQWFLAWKAAPDFLVWHSCLLFLQENGSLSIFLEGGGPASGAWRYLGMAWRRLNCCCWDTTLFVLKKSQNRNTSFFRLMSKRLFRHLKLVMRKINSLESKAKFVWPRKGRENVRESL